MLYAERDYRELKCNIFCFKIKSGYVGKDGVIFGNRHANQLLLFVFEKLRNQSDVNIRER